VRVTEFKIEIDVAREMLDVLKERFRVSRVVFYSSTDLRSGRSAPWSLLRRPDPGRPSDYGKVARRNVSVTPLGST